MVEVPEKAKLAFACAGIFFSFSYFAVLQEDVYKKPYSGEYFKYTFLALVCERGINAAIGALGVLLLGGSGLKIPLLDILWSGTSQMFAMAGSNEALRYVSYPTQVRAPPPCLPPRSPPPPPSRPPARLPSPPTPRAPTGPRQVLQDGPGDGGRHRARRQELRALRVPAGGRRGTIGPHPKPDQSACRRHGRTMAPCCLGSSRHASSRGSGFGCGQAPRYRGSRYRGSRYLGRW